MAHVNEPTSLWLPWFIYSAHKYIQMDLVVTVSVDMKVSEQCKITATKGKILWLIKGNRIYEEKQLIILLYKVRPRVENCIQARWPQYYRKRRRMYITKTYSRIKRPYF